jgi:hypothetical protein
MKRGFPYEHYDWWMTKDFPFLDAVAVTERQVRTVRFPPIVKVSWWRSFGLSLFVWRRCDPVLSST